MYEHQTYETILQRMLSRVSNNVDKREGSVIYDACAAAAAELAQMYIELAIQQNLSFADTASDEYLTRRCAEFGVNRLQATKANREGRFYDQNNNPFNVPLHSRYSIEQLNYIVIEQLSSGRYILECEVPGVVGNQKFGSLLPIDYINGLTRAELTDVLLPGQDTETDDSLRKRFYEIVNEPSFGGNIADYKRHLTTIPGVSGVKIFPVWNGGGTVKCTIISSNFDEPSTELMSKVQNMVDPTIHSGKGLGIAPIGHTVTITGTKGITIDIHTTVTLAAGTTIDQIRTDIENVIEAYLLELRRDWANQTQLIIRTAQLDSRILTVSGVEDVTGTTVNGTASNLTLGEDEIPVLGVVLVHE